MSWAYPARVAEVAAAPGTGVVTLGGAVSGSSVAGLFRTFASILSNGDTCKYVIFSAAGWERGIGTYNTGTLTRTTVQESSNANAAVNFTTTVTVFLDIANPADYIAQAPAKATPVGADKLGLWDSVTGAFDSVTVTALQGVIGAITLTGDVTGSGTGSIATTVGKINGVSLAGLATGVLKNTTTTGVPSIATAGTDYSAGTAGLATGILKSTTLTGALTIATAGTDYSAGTSGLATGLLKSTTLTGALTIAAAGTDYVAPGAVTTSGLTMTTARLLGRTTSTTGAIEEITVGTGLVLSAGSLTATATAGGGSVTSGSVTLTSSSNKAQQLVFTAYGQYVKLPDATTCSKDVNLFGLYNASQFWGIIYDSTSVIRGFIAPWTRVGVDLAGNGTAAGQWDLDGAALFGPTAALRSTTSLGNNAAGRIYAIQLDTNRFMLLRAATVILATVYDQSTQTWGNEVTVRTVTVACWVAIKSNTDQVLVVSDNGSNYDAITMTMSGTTITLNTGTRGTAVTTGSSGFGEMIAVGSAFVFSYYRGTTTQGMRCVTISGTAPTIGAEVTQSTTGTIASNTYWTCPHMYAVSSTVVLALGCTAAAGTMFAIPYSISGTTLNVGTGTTFGAGGGSFTFRTHVLGSRWAVIWGASAQNGAVISMSSTTASATTVSTIVSSGGGVSTTDTCVIGSKVFVVTCTSGVFRFNLMTDTGGTASAGTAIALPASSGTAGCGISRVDGNIVRVLGVSATGVATSRGDIHSLDCSGSSVTVSQTDIVGFQSAAAAYPTHPFGGTRLPFNMKSGAGWGYLSGADQASNPTLLVGTTEVVDLPQSRIPFQPNSGSQGWLFSAGGCGVISDYDSWWNGLTTGANGSAGGILRIQGAQP